MLRLRVAGACIMIALALTITYYWGANDGEKAPDRERLHPTATGQTTGEGTKPNKESQEEGTRTNGDKKTSRTLAEKAGGKPGGIRHTGQYFTEHEAAVKAAYEAKRKAKKKREETKNDNRLSSRSNGLPTSQGTFLVTAYTAGFESTGKNPGDPGYGVTATGATVQEGVTIAADWDVLPPGTVVKIEGLPGDYVVQDRGGGVKGNHIDLYIADLEKARQWGKEYREIYVKEWGSR